MVTQSSSMRSTVTGVQKTTEKKEDGSTRTVIKQANISMTGQFKVDVATWNMRVDMNITGRITGIKENITAELSIVLNTQKKHAALRLKQTHGPPDYLGDRCSKTPLPPNVTPAYISSEWSKVVKPMLKQHLSCAGHDGTYDTFTGNLDLEKLREQFPEIPQVDGTNANVNIKLSKDGLIHGYDASATMRQVVTSPVQAPGYSSYQMTADMSDVIAKGPSEADLDTSDWTDCKDASPGDALASIDALPLKGEAAQMHMLLNMIHAAAKKEEVVTIV